MDNLQYDSGQYDFAVIATTRDVRLEPDAWPPIMNMFIERNAFATKHDSARFVLKVCNDDWKVGSYEYKGELFFLHLTKGKHNIEREYGNVQKQAILLHRAAVSG